MRSVGDHVRAGLAHGVTTHRGRAGSPGRLIVFVLSLLIACASYALVQAGPAHAAAAVSVSKSVSSKPLLGGQATCRITVTNTGDTKGYNLSLTDVVSSSRPDPEGRVRVVSVADADGTVFPTAVRTDPATGDTTLQLDNVRDLASGESYTLTLVLSIADDPSWRVGDLLLNGATATLREFPDGSGATYTGAANASAEVVPVKLVSKSVQQSTGVHQATGVEAWPYRYSLRVQNNPVAPTDAVVVTDVIPDGVEFLGVVAGPDPDAGYPSRDPVTGVTTVRWTLGTMAADQTQVITYAAGIRYDYYGTANGGTNRPADDFSGTPPTGRPIPDKTSFTNDAGLTAVFQGAPATDSATASVSGAYLTIAKRADVSTGGNGTEVSYTLTYCASEYYDIVEHASPDSVVVRDTVPNGMTYVPGSAAPTPSSVTINADGTTSLVWGPEVLDALPHGAGASVTFRATVDEDWSGALDGLPIVAGDSLINTCSVAGWWTDLVDSSREDSTSDATSSVVFSTGKPGVEKDMQAPDIAVWTDSVTATVGDVLRVRVRFNTHDGATPARSDIRFGRIVVTDWLPPGVAYNGDATVTYSRASDFSQPPSPPTFPAINYAGAPNPVSVADLHGVQWALGNVEKGGWWQAEFTVTVQDVAAVRQGTVVNNLWKLTGVDTHGVEYSDRDATEIAYCEPHLTLAKDASSVPSPLLPSGTVRYTTTIRNTGECPAQDVVVVDTVAAGMRATPPQIASVALDGTPLAAGTDYRLTPAYDAATGVFTIDFHDPAAPAVDTPIPAGSTLTITYDCRVDGTAVADATLTNIASVGYDTQADGSGRATPTNTNVAADNTDDASVTVGGLGITKSVNPPSATPVTIGDTLTYTLRCTVPAGLVAYWPSLRDTINRDGFSYVPGSATLTQISGTPNSPAAFDASTAPDPLVDAGGNNRTRFTWRFANPIDNGGQSTDYVFEIRFDVLITGIEDDGTTWEFGLPAANDAATDSADLQWNRTNPATRPGTLTSSIGSNSVTSNIRQPLLTLGKTATSSPPYAGGSTVTYTSVISHDAARSRWPAHDLLWTDTLAPQLEAPAIVSVTRTVGATSTVLVPGVDYIADLSARPISIDFSAGTSQTSLPTNGTITITYTARIVRGTGAGAAIDNTADVDWSNAEGTPPGSRRYTDTDQASSWTRDTDSETVRVSAAALRKTASPATATIGEVVSYRVRVTVPAETRLIAPPLSDVIATTGMVYVPGSAVLTHVSGTPATPAALTGAVTESRQPGSSTLTFPLAAPIDNSDPDTPVGDEPYVFDLTYDVVITGTSPSGAWIWDPAAPPNGSADTATLVWSDGAATRRASDDAAVSVVQPLLRLTKTFDQHTLDSAQPVHTTVVIVNDGESTAYENPRGFDFTDAAPPGFSSPTDITVTHSANGLLTLGTDYTVDIDGNDLRIEYTSRRTDLAPGESLTITYTNDLDPAAATPGRSFTNFADADYASLPPGGGDHMRIYDDDPDDPFLDDRAQDSDTVVIAGAAVIKTSGAPGGQATIGQAYDYTVTLAIPQGTTAYRGVVTDVVPDGLTVLAASVSHGTVTHEVQSDGTTLVTWTLPTPFSQTLPPDDPIVPTMTIGVRVDDAYAGGDAVNGLPPQDTLVNEAEFEWWDEPSGGTPLSAKDDDTVTVVEPRLTIDKQVSPASAGAGEVVTFTVVIGNTGTATAHDLAWQDDLPAGLFSPPGSPVLLSVVHSTLGPLNATSFTSDFSTNPVSLDFDEATHPVVPVDLAPGATLTITYQATVAGGVASGAELTDTAGVTGSSLAGADEAREYGPVEDSATVTTRAPELSVTKTVTAGSTVERGGTVSFRIEVQNTGDAVARRVDVADRLPDGPFGYVDGSTSATWPAGFSTSDPTGAPGPSLGWPLGATLQPGESVVLTFDVAVGRADPGQYANTTTATGEDASGAPVDPDTDTARFDVVKPSEGPAVQVDKHLAPGQPATVTVGQFVTYEIVVTNTGGSSIETLPLIDTYPTAYLSYGSAVPAPDATAAGQLSWTDLTGAGELAPGDSVTVSVTFVTTAPNRSVPVVNTARVTGAVDEYGDPVPDAEDDDSSATVVPPVTHPAVAVDKQRAPGQPDPVVRGDETTFRIVVTNTGDVPLTTVPLRDTFDTTYLEFVSASPAPDDTATAGRLVWDDLTGAGGLAPTESVTVTVTFRTRAATSSTADTALVSGATDQWDQPAEDASDTASVGIREPEAHVAVSKQLAADQPATVTVGDAVAFDIVVRNTGDTALVTVPLRDTFDESRLEFASADPAPDDTTTAGRLEWNDLTGPGSLAPGESITVRVSFTAVAAAESTVNSARVAGAKDGDDREAPAAEDDAGLTVAPLPASLSVRKSLADGQPSRVYVGDRVRFTVVVENTGRATLDVVPLTEVYGSGVLEYVGADPAPDTVGDGTLAWSDLTGSGSLAPGESITVRLRFEARAVTAAADDVVTVHGATTDDGRTVPDVSDDATVTIVPRGELRLVKTVKDVNGGALVAGDELLWRIEVSNPSRADVKQVLVTDTVPRGTVYVAGSIAGRGGDDSAAPRLRWRIGTLKKGARVVVTFRSRVRGGLPAGTAIRNTARVQGFEVDPHTAGVGGVVSGHGSALARTSGGGYAGVGTAGAIALAGLLLGLWGRARLLGTRRAARHW